MTEEVQNLAAAEPAPAPVVTTTTESEVEKSETPEEEPKLFTQKELEATFGKRLAQLQRKWEREQAQRFAEAQVVKVAPTASIDQFESPEAYAEALKYQKAEEIVAQRDAAKQRAQVLESYHDLEEEARGKYDDFEQVAYNPRLPITDVMAETIQSSDVGPELAYYLGSNPRHADRISKMSPLSQAKEIGKIEAKLASDPPVRKTTSAPSPISPVTARSSGSSAYDTTDPRSIKTMTTSQWIEADRKRQVKKWEAQHR